MNEIARKRLGPRGVPGAPDTAKMTPQEGKNIPKCGEFHTKRDQIGKQRVHHRTKHRRPLPKRYTWEIYRKGVCLSVEESRGEFGSWEEASLVGNKALRQFLQAS
jgi:hypothetical protein